MRMSKNVVEGYIKLGTIVSVAVACLILVFAVAHRLWADLPAEQEQWTPEAINAVGSSTYSGTATDTFTINAGGAGVKGNSDSCYMLYQSVEGNVEITARIGSLQNTTPHTSAGVMLRESSNSASVHAYVSVSPDKGIVLTTRTLSGSMSSTLAGPMVATPVWLRLARNGGVLDGSSSHTFTVSAYYSSNGVNWTLVGSQTMTMASAIQMGMAVASNDAVAISTVNIDGVSALSNVPQTTSNLVLWLRGDAGLTIDGSNKVSAWSDQSGNGHHALPATSTASPTLTMSALNGLPVVQFNSAGGTRLSISNSTLLNPSAGVSVMAVVRRTSGATVARVLSKTNGSTGYGLDFSNGTTVRSLINNTSSASTTLAATISGVVAAIYSTTDGNKIYVNGGAPVLATYSTAIVSNTTSVGLGGDAVGGSYLDGEIAELLVFNKAITDDERKDVEAYLYEKYGVGTQPTVTPPQTSLPSGTYTTSQTITLSIPLGSKVYYTEDGSTPTFSSTLYTGGPITINSTKTIKAIAIKFGYVTSSVSSSLFYFDTISGAVPRTDLALWLKPDVGVTTSSGRVTYWADQSGNGHDAFQTVEASQPSYVANAKNNMPGVRFTGASGLTITNSTGLNPETISIIAVYKKTGGSYSRILSKYTTNLGYLLENTNTAECHLWLAGVTSFASSVTDGDYNLVSGIYNKVESKFYVNRTLTGTRSGTTSIGNSVSVPVTLGRDPDGSYPLVGDIVEILLYMRGITDSERQDIESYLYQKYFAAAPPMVDAPTISLPTGIYTGSQSATLSATTGATIYYTLDGATPTIASSSSSSPLTVTITDSRTIKAMAVKSGFSNSDVTSRVITIDASSSNVARSGLFAWLRADVGVVTNGTLVSQWQDQSGNGNHVRQDTTTNQPTWVSGAINAQPVVRFSAASSTRLTVANNASLHPASGKSSMIAVVKRTSGSGISWVLCKYVTSNPTGYGLYLNGATANSWINNSSDATSALTLGTYGVVEGIYDQSYNKVYVNGGTPGSVAYSVAIASNSNPLSIGADSSGTNPLDGDIAEVLLYNRALSDAERQKVEVYLYDRYGIGTATKANAPVANVNGGIYTTAQTVTLTNSTPGTQFFYTLDGSMPTRSSSSSQSITITQSATLKVRAVVDGLAMSDVASYTYTIDSSAANVLLPGIMLWLRADMGVSTSSGKVTRWDDQSGRGYSAVQTVTTSQPQMASSSLNGWPMIRFTSTSSSLLTLNSTHSSGLNPTSGKIHALAVVKRSSGTAAARILSKYGSSTGYALGFASGTAPSSVINGNGVTSSKLLDTYGIVESVYDQTQNQVRVFDQPGGAATYSAAIATNSTLVGIGGDAGGGNYLDGDIAEILVYDGVLTSTQSQAIRSYLTGKYGADIAQEKLPAPTIGISSGLYGSQQLVDMTTSGTIAADIYFSVDGSNPLWNTKYSDPIVIGSSATLKAVAVAAGYRSSDVTTRTLIIDTTSAKVSKTGLQLWLRGDAGVTADGNGKVSGWQDQSGNGNHAAQLTATYCPTLTTASTTATTSVPVIRFNPTSTTSLSIADSVTLNPTTVTQSGSLSGTVSMIAVVKRSSGSSTARILSKYASTTTNSGYVLDYTAGTTVRSLLNNTNAATATVTASTFGVVESVYDKVLNKIYVNGVTPGVSTYSTAVASNTASVGIGADSSGSNGLDGDIAEVLFYNRALTDTERQDIEAYLYQRYGVGTKPTAVSPTISVPSGNYVDAQNVTLTGPAGAVLYFTTDGSTPTTNSAVYTSPFTIRSTTTLKVMAVKDGYQSSSVVTSVIAIDRNPGTVARNGLLVWLRADMGVTTSSGKVTRWEDQSGSGNHATQTVSSQQPNYVPNVASLSGQPTIRFNSANSTMLQIPDNTGLNPNRVSMIAVIQRSSGTGYAIIVSKYLANSAGYLMGFMSTTTLYSWMSGGYSQGTFPTGVYGIVEGIYDQVQNKIYVNGTVSGAISQTGAIVSNTKDMYIGGAYNGSQFDGDIAEVLVYNRAITDVERQSIEVYLGQKYGLGNVQTATAPTISLASGLYSSTQSVTLSGAAGAVLYYTYTPEGTVPTTDSARYNNTALTLSTSGTLKVIAVETGKGISSVSSCSYVIDPASASVPRSGMAVWLRADYGVVKDGNNKVSTWQDQSGGAHHATAPSTAAQPVWTANAVNGQAVLRFDGVANELQGAAGFDAGSSDTSIFVVQKRAVATDWVGVVSFNFNGKVGEPLLTWRDNQRFGMNDSGRAVTGVYVDLSANSSGYWVNDYIRSGGTYGNGGTVTIRAIDSSVTLSSPLVSSGTQTWNSDSGATTYGVGRHWFGGSEMINGDIAEVIIYSRALNSTERGAVETYLWRKYIAADSDNNGLSDSWEVQYFGHIGVNKDADEDGDGLTNEYEYNHGTDPTQYYNGATPTLRIVGGDGQTAATGTYAPQALTVQVVDANNHILSNAPIRFAVTSTLSDGKLSNVGAVGAVTTTTLDLRTQIDGYGAAYAKLPTTSGSMTIAVSAVGTSATSVSFTLQANSGTVLAPTIAADANYFAATRTLTIACPTSGADIRYTLDGSLPTQSSSTITNGGTLTATDRTLIRVKAFKAGCSPSPEKTMLVLARANQQQLLAHGHYSMLLNSAGEVWNWGDNSCGQLGQPFAVTSQSSPIKLAGLSASSMIAAGDYHAAGLVSTASASAWSVGANWFGQLGDGAVLSNSTPVAVQTLTNVTALAAGEYHTLAVKSGGTVWAWGANWYGGLGNGTTTNSAVPVQVSTLSNIIAVSAGGVHSLALTGTGTVSAWGGNLYGQLGLGSTTDRTTAATITALNPTTLSRVIAIASGSVHSLALKSDGTVWAWGWNDYGQLGDGTATQRTSPVAVKYMANATTSATLTNVIAIAAGRYHSLAITKDGKLWTWGYNGTGQVGNGSTTNQLYATALTDNSPKGFTNIVLAAGGYNHSLAITADGSLWAWGDNSLGQLGLGGFSTTSSSIPVKIDFAIDSDGDGLTDLYEIVHGYDPIKADSNGDGLSDAVSEQMGIDPVNPDVDGDGVSNADELLRGTNPLVIEIGNTPIPGTLDIHLIRPTNATPVSGN